MCVDLSSIFIPSLSRFTRKMEFYLSITYLRKSGSYVYVCVFEPLSNAKTRVNVSSGLYLACNQCHDFSYIMLSIFLFFKRAIYQRGFNATFFDLTPFIFVFILHIVTPMYYYNNPGRC